MTVHDFDMSRFLVESEVDEVYALGEVRVDPEIGGAGDLDTAVVAMRHADRTLTVVDNSRRSAYGYDQRLEAFGSAGMAASGNPLAHTARSRPRWDQDTASAPLRRALRGELHHAVGCFRQRCSRGRAPGW
jgi:myo-inositol 2-dehydrogenase/D-chiro-inositol 1-dehydrogenase